MSGALARQTDVDLEIVSYLDEAPPRSFYLYAGAGSGKTRSLVNAVKHLISKHRSRLLVCGQKIGVITYTNAACNEIQSRIDFDPLIYVSTIHSFAWNLIEGHNGDIRSWLKVNLETDIAELNEQQLKGRASKASEDRAKSIASKTRRLEELPTIKKFVYSPQGDNLGRDALNHAEVIKMSAHFLETKPGLRSIMTCRYPILFIDESQDTLRELMDAFLKVEAETPGFCLGLFGDAMQRIYGHGKQDLAASIPNSWGKPSKDVNYRCPKRVIALINKISEAVHDHKQTHAEDTEEGTVRLFIVRSSNLDRAKVESEVVSVMASEIADPGWTQPDGVKRLILEHHMAATRMSFQDFFKPLYQASLLKTGLLDGTLPGARFFSKDVLPLVKALRKNDRFAVATHVRTRSPLLDKKVLAKAGDEQLALLTRAKEACEKLKDLVDEENDPTFFQVLDCITETGLFEIPESLELPLAIRRVPLEEGFEPAASEATLAWVEALGTSFKQIEPYDLYVSDKAPFGTHQGVKGLEFPRVLVVIDDEEAGGFLFSYEKLFGAKEKSKTDIENEAAGKDNAISRTSRLFYVTCSRAEESLAIIAYSADPEVVKEYVISEGWFTDNEIVML
ncbi:MAG: ATP-dependent helicase [Armatimonadetes bacterium]|nr:ATP-dependent helicase [Armatimonadota bacterium]